MVLHLLKNRTVWIVLVLLVTSYFVMDGEVLGYVIWDSTPDVPADLGTFATCLTDSGAKFYGAFWCGHCNDQKKMFGDYAKNLPFVECSDSEGMQTEACAEAGIEGYPTWVFADGSSQAGKLSFEILAEKSGCKI